MSRLIIKNLPKHYTDANLRELVSFAGEVTDARVIRTRDGRTRQFGFVGFRTPQEAKSARYTLNKSYVDTTQVSVDFAHAVGDEKLPRPWSKYSAGSSKHDASVMKDDEGERRKFLEKERKRMAAIRARKRDDATTPQKGMIEFAEVAGRRSSHPVWADGAVGTEKTILVSSRKTGAEGKMLERKHTTFDDSDDSDAKADDLYEDLPQAVTSVQNDAQSEEVGNETALNETVSDMQYFKSKIVPSGANGDIPDAAEVNAEDANGTASDPEDEDSDNESDTDEADAGKQARSNDVVVPAACGGNEVSYAELQARGTLGSKPDEGTVKSELSNRRTYHSDGTDAAETGRLLVRNLPFSATEEELESTFEPFGTLSDVHIVKDSGTGKSKGIAFVQYMIPQNAPKALMKLDGTFFSGRILHLLPAKPRPAGTGERVGTNVSTKPGSSSFKNEKELALKEAARLGEDRTSQHAMHMSADAVANVAAHRHGVSKADLFGTEKGESGIAAVRLAMAEATVQGETRKFLLERGVDLTRAAEASAELTANTSVAKRKRLSRTAFLAKNLPARTTEAELDGIFARFGTIRRVIVVPSGLLAVIEYATALDAKRAYNSLAYTKFRDSPLYLEWLPSSALQSSKSADGYLVSEANGLGSNSTVGESPDALSRPSTDDAEQASSVYVKNLNFDTRDKELKAHFVKVLKKRPKLASSLRSATVAMKRSKDSKTSDKLSMGFGFLEFTTRSDAVEAMKLAQNTSLDGHVLQLRLSNQRDDSQKRTVSKRKRSTLGPRASPKLIVRNVAFEATRKDIRRLFGAFGQLKTVRLPRKMDGSHRGFAFVEFVSKGEATAALEALASAHLYGRHLVVEYAEEVDNQHTSVTNLQEKTAEHMSKKRIRRSHASQLDTGNEEDAIEGDADEQAELQDALYG